MAFHDVTEGCVSWPTLQVDGPSYGRSCVLRNRTGLVAFAMACGGRSFSWEWSICLNPRSIVCSTKAGLAASDA